MKRIVIFLNGELADSNGVKNELRRDDILICADAGLRHALRLGHKPDLLIGDLDSVSETDLRQVEKEAVRIEKFPSDKDKTDFELAVQEALRQGAEELLIIAPFGNRLDHTLGNILLAAFRLPQQLPVMLFDGSCRGYLLRAEGELELQLVNGETVSFLPLTAKVSKVCSEGFKWPLQQAELEIGSSLSLSNRIVEPHARLSIGEGVLLVIQLSEDAV